MALLTLVAVFPLGGAPLVAQDTPVEKDLFGLMDAASGRNSQFRMRAVFQLPMDGQTQDIMVDLNRDGQDYDLSLVHSDYSMIIRRRGPGTALAIPRHRVVYIGMGEAPAEDGLDYEGLAVRVISAFSEFGSMAPLMIQGQPAMVMNLAKSALGAKIDGEAGTIKFGGVTIRSTQPGQLAASSGPLKFRAGVKPLDQVLQPLDDWPGYRVESLDRGELERTVVRGIRRATEVLMPGDLLKTPQQMFSDVENGKLLWIDGQRVVVLRGTPEQIGKAHGELLKFEAGHCIDSVLNMFGLVQTLTTGKWFRQELDDAFAQLKEHIPQRFRDENRALAAALEQPPELIDALNVFPELFHCSGFAALDSATLDGRLYHGRVLDYMSAIGLQGSATTFVIVPEGRIPFVSVGYAGFTGCVTGMNAEQISLGEMGGGGEGRWDGVPMATLMRLALEDCSTLDEVMKLWQDSPRTCEYYYVFADGKANQAVGVAAVPERVEFVRPGESHPRLGEGIKDAVVLSADERLETLRQRIQEKHGLIDAEVGMWLMSRPVAMQTNLHNVLFVPAEGVLYVSNANHQQPAADRPYAMIELRKLLE